MVWNQPNLNSYDALNSIRWSNPNFMHVGHKITENHRHLMKCGGKFEMVPRINLYDDVSHLISVWPIIM